MEETNILWLLFLTFLFYCFLPIMIRIFLGKQNKSKAKKIVIINSIIIYLFYAYISIINDYDRVPNAYAAFFWSTIAYAILKKDTDDTLYDKFPKVLPSYSNTKKLTNLYLKNLMCIIENQKLFGKINPYTNEEIENFEDIKKYYKQYLNDKAYEVEHKKYDDYYE